jgi:hypothetical protein
MIISIFQGLPGKTRKFKEVTKKMKQDQIEKHSTTQSVILHLLPGILVGCFYFLARQPVANMGYPSIVTL